MLTMDSFPGFKQEPMSLHKYLYVYASPINNIDPSGNITMAEVSVVNNIVGILTQFQISNAFNVFDTLGVSNENIETARTIFKYAGIFTLGAAGVKLAQIGAKKVVAKCAGAEKCIRAHFGRVATPHGTARQLNSSQAWAALEKVQAGAPLYRIGSFNRSKVTDAQFWSLKDPRKMDPTEFADAFGIPPQNANFDFVVVGTLPPGRMAITRQAPGVGGNVGGAIEVVTPPNSVVLEGFFQL